MQYIYIDPTSYILSSQIISLNSFYSINFVAKTAIVQFDTCASLPLFKHNDVTAHHIANFTVIMVDPGFLDNCQDRVIV